MDYTLVIRATNENQALIYAKQMLCDFEMLTTRHTAFWSHWIVRVRIDEYEPELVDGILNRLMHTTPTLVWWTRKVAA